MGYLQVICTAAYTGSSSDLLILRRPLTPCAVYMITPSNRFISSVSGITFPEREEYILVFEVPGYFALIGRAEISISAMKISQGLSQIGGIAANISSIRGDLGILNSSLSQRISILEANVASIFSGLDVVRESIRNLSMGLASSQQQISILGRNITDLSASLSSLRSSFQDFMGSFERRLSDLGTSPSGKAVGFIRINVPNISE